LANIVTIIQNDQGWQKKSLKTNDGIVGGLFLQKQVGIWEKKTFFIFRHLLNNVVNFDESFNKNCQPLSLGMVQKNATLN